MVDTHEQLINAFASLSEKNRPTFLIQARDNGNQPRVFDGGNIRLGAINMAKRLKKQLDYNDVQILHWNVTKSKYYPDDETQLLAFPAPKAGVTPAGDLAQTRKGAFALEQFLAIASRIRVSRQYNVSNRKALVDAFVVAYKEVGGSGEELYDNIESSLTNGGGGL